MMKKVIVFLILSIVISCEEENTPPECSITSPDNGAVFVVGDTVEIVVDAWGYETDISVVEFYVGVFELGFTESYPYRYDWITEGADEYTIVAVAHDWNRGFASDKKTVTVKEKTAGTD